MAARVTTRSIRSTSTLKIKTQINLKTILALNIVLNISDPQNLLPFLSYGIVESLLVVRRPRHPIGWLLLLIATKFSTIGRQDIVAQAITSKHTAQLPLVIQIQTVVAVGLIAHVVLLATIFPTDKLPVGKNNRPTQITLALVAAIMIVQAVGPLFETQMPNKTTVRFANPIKIAPN